MDRSVDGMRCGSWVIDVATNERILVTNGICILPHDSQEAYQASHKEHIGCVHYPWEGLVFEMVGETMRTWRMEIINTRNLRPSHPTDGIESLRTQYEKKVQEICKFNRRRK